MVRHAQPYHHLRHKRRRPRRKHGGCRLRAVGHDSRHDRRRLQLPRTNSAGVLFISCNRPQRRVQIPPLRCQAHGNNGTGRTARQLVHVAAGHGRYVQLQRIPDLRPDAYREVAILHRSRHEGSVRRSRSRNNGVAGETCCRHRYRSRHRSPANGLPPCRLYLCGPQQPVHRDEVFARDRYQPV